MLWENSQTLANSYSIPNGKSAVTAGPVTLGSGVTVTLGATSRWVVVLVQFVYQVLVQVIMILQFRQQLEQIVLI